MERQPARKIEVIGKKPFVIFYATEKKVLYEPDEDNMVTRNVGEQAGLDHMRAFSEPHEVLVVELGKSKIQ